MALVTDGELVNARRPTIKELEEIIASGGDVQILPSGDVAVFRDGAPALDFLRRCGGEYRIVSSGDLTIHQIAEARANGLFYVEPGGGLGWALLPWDLTTDKDRKRETEYFAAQKQTT